MSRSFCFDAVLDRPFDELARRLLDDPGSAFADTLWPSQRVAMAELDATVAGVHVDRHVVLEMGEPYPRGTRELVVPIRWRAADHPRAYPTADAVLELVALSTHPPRTQVSIVGTYQPPFGWLGDALDRLGGEHIASSSLEHLLEHVTARLTASAGVAAAG